MQITEAFTDYYIIQDSTGYGRKWHKTDAIYYFLILLAFLVLSNNYKIIIFAVTARWFLFNTLLNFLRNREFWYRGKKGIDKYLLKYRKIIWYLSIISFIISLIYIFL